MPQTANDDSLADRARAAAKDLLVGLAIGVGVYVLWVLLHSILFGIGG